MAPGGNCFQTSSLPFAILQELWSWSYLAPLQDLLVHDCLCGGCWKQTASQTCVTFIGEGISYGLNICGFLPPDSYVETLTLIVLVLESRDLGRWWRHGGINALKKGAEENSSVPSAMWSFSGKMTMYMEMGCLQTPRLQCLGLELCGFQNCEK